MNYIIDNRISILHCCVKEPVKQTIFFFCNLIASLFIQPTRKKRRRKREKEKMGRIFVSTQRATIQCVSVLCGIEKEQVCILK